MDLGLHMTLKETESFIDIYRREMDLREVDVTKT